MIETLIFLGAGFLFWLTTVVIDRRKIVPRVTVCEELANLRKKYRYINGCRQAGTTLPLEMVLQALPTSVLTRDEGLVGCRLYGCTIVCVRGLEVDFAYP